MQSRDDSALLRDYCENQSNDAFTELVNRHINLVYSLALRYVGNPHQAEEITHAVFIILAKKAVSLRHDKALSSWLFQATHLTANNLVRSESRRHRREQKAYMQSLLNQPDAGIWKDIAPLLDNAVARLNGKDRRAIVLRFYEGRSLHEIGVVMGGNEESAKKRVARALEKLRTYFFKRGVDSQTAAIAGTISANSVHAAPAGLAKAVSAVAAAKGMAASASTLTLIKGALNLMAWTKIKTAVTVGVAVVLAIGTTTVTVKQFAPVSVEEAFKHYDSDHYLGRAPKVLLLRPTQYANQGSWINDNDNRLLGRNRSIAWVLAAAYGTGPERMVLPHDLPPGGYDYLITSSTNPSVALQAEIEKQFNLIARFETATNNILVLKAVSSTGPGLKMNRRQTHNNSVMANWADFRLGHCTMSDFANTLAGYALNTPVVDETGWTNTFDITLRWDGKSDASNHFDVINEAMKNQLGLELAPAQRAIQMLVVDYDGGHDAGLPLRRVSWEFKGYTTPEDTFESMLWAMNQGDDKAFLACLTPNCQTQFLDKHRGGPNRNLVALNQGRAAKIGAYQVLSEERLSDSETILFVRSTKLGKAQFTLKMLAREWKVDRMPD